MSYKAETTEVIHIGEAAQRLGVTPVYLRLLERKGVIPAPRRDLNGRIYTEFDLALFRSMGVGSRPRALRTAEEALESGRG